MLVFLNLAESEAFQSIEHLGGIIGLSDNNDLNKAIDISNKKELYHCPTLNWYYTGQVPEDNLRVKAGT